MAGSLLGTRQEAAPPNQPADARIQKMIRRLVSELNHGAAQIGADVRDGRMQDVIMDLEVDGPRCRITRLPRKPAPSRIVLSPREREIARMVAKGYPNKTIAGVLEISCWTVGTYLRRIFAKLNVCSRAAMVARILEDGLLEKSLGPP
jgi:DNA-binding NarL/FixJ family response regulator